MAAEQEETTTLYFSWEGVNPDPVQYKPYSPQFMPVNLYVALDVPDKFILAWDHHPDESDDFTVTVITPEGMAWCAEKLSQGLSKVKLTGAK